MEEQNVTVWEKRFGRDSLKMAALITMLIDHIACVFVPAEGDYRLYTLLRMIGRLSFPIYCFLLVQGFQTTRSLRNYLLRLAVFAFLSEIPFDLAFYHTIFYPAHQSVMITLFLALAVLSGWKKFAGSSFLQFVVLFAGLCLAELLHCDYGAFGILLPFVFYIYREKPFAMYCFMAVLQVLQGRIQAAAICAIPFLMAYNPKQGEKRLPGYFFYAFYPVHLLVLWLAAACYSHLF